MHEAVHSKVTDIKAPFTSLTSIGDGYLFSSGAPFACLPSYDIKNATKFTAIIYFNFKLL